MDSLDIAFTAWAFLFQALLILHFALRKWAFDPYIPRYGRFFYFLALPGAGLSVALLLAGKNWSFWLGGFLFLAFSVFGYIVEYVRGITDWRKPVRWRIMGPYVSLYLATVMFYWWPLAQLYRPLWFIYAGLFAISTVLNISSH